MVSMMDGDEFDGASAFEAGVALDANPHTDTPVVSWEGDAWRRGWSESVRHAAWRRGWLNAEIRSWGV